MNLKIFLFTLLLSGFLFAQDSLKIVDQSTEKLNQGPVFKNSLGEIKINLDESGYKNIKFGLSSQIWLRSIENNPGTLVNNVPQDHTYDASLRRMRISISAQLSNYYSIVMQLGINNQSFISGGGTGTRANGKGKKPKIFFMDAYNGFAIIPRKNEFTKEENKNHLYLGAGLHSWGGVSRMTNASTTKLLTADLPEFNFPNIEVSDQLSRQFGVFVHGDFNKLNYRAAVNKPFATDRIPEVGEIVDNNLSGKLSYAAYAMYQFFDKENTETSFFAGTYLGKKKVFNIGAGFYSTKNATLSQPTEGNFESHNEFIFGVDTFLDLPIGQKSKEMSLSLYSVLYRYNMGPDYLRTTGIINPGTADPNCSEVKALEGFGNARVLLGTGNIWYSQLGFVLPKFSNTVKLQSFFAYTSKDLEALNEIGDYFDIGANLFILAQNAKIAYQYSSRPLYTTDIKDVFTRKGEHLITLQIAF